MDVSPSSIYEVAGQRSKALDHSYLSLRWNSTVRELVYLRNTDSTCFRRSELILEAQMKELKSAELCISRKKDSHVISRHLTSNLTSSHRSDGMFRLLRSMRSMAAVKGTRGLMSMLTIELDG